MTLNNVLTVIDCDMVFSGSLRPFLQQEDPELIVEDLKELASFPFKEILYYSPIVPPFPYT